MAKKAPSQDGQLLQLDPSVILAEDNPRYGLRNIETFADEILARGGVIEPVEVRQMPEGTENANGYKYVLNFGFRRHAAVTHLNKTAGAGLMLPAIVRSVTDPTELLRRQLAENMERENQSPMDQAIAIKRLLDAGLTKIEVRQVFARPGGRKGNKTQPASNSFINMTLSFLELPKPMQCEIHEGTIGVATAYELTKVAPELRAEVLEAAKAAHEKELEREEKQEERTLAKEKKAAEEKDKMDTLKATLTEAEEDNTKAQEVLVSASTVEDEAFRNHKSKHDTVPEKKAAADAFKSAQEARKLAEKAADVTQKVYEKHFKTYTDATTAAQEKATKLAEAKSKPKQEVSSADVKKAAKDTGASRGAVALTVKEIRDAVGDVCLPGGSEKVIAIGKLFRSMILGEITTSKLCKELEKVVGK